MKHRTIILAALVLVGAAILFLNSPRRATNRQEQTAPAFEVTDAVSGQRLSSADLKDKIIFVHFWASW